MASGRSIVRLTGAATIVAGAVIAFASFWVGNASGPGTVLATVLGRSLVTSWTMTWGDLTFSVFWLGIAITIPGIVAVLSQSRHKHHEKARVEREIGRQVLRERAAESDG